MPPSSARKNRLPVLAGGSSVRWSGPLPGVGLELGDLRRTGRAGDVEGDLAQRRRGEGDDAGPAAGGQHGAGAVVDDLPGTDDARGAGRLADVDPGHRGGGAPLDRDGTGRAGRRPEGAQVTVAHVAVSRPGGLAGAVGSGTDAEVGPGGLGRTGRGAGRTRRAAGRPRTPRRQVAFRHLQALVGTGRLADDLRHAAGPVEAVRVRDADGRVGLRVRPGGVVLAARHGPGDVVEDVAADLPVAGLAGIEGAQHVLGVLEVVVLHLGVRTGPGVDAGLDEARVRVVVDVRRAATQQRRARVDVLVRVVVERDEAVRAVALAGADQAAAAGVAQDAVGQGHVLGVVLHVEEPVEALRLPARGLQGDVIDPDVADGALHAD